MNMTRTTAEHIVWKETTLLPETMFNNFLKWKHTQ